MGLLNVTTGIREKSNFKIKGGFKTIFYSIIAFIATLLVWGWVTGISIKDVLDFLAE